MANSQLKCIFNTLFRDGIFPSSLKCAIVTPDLKKSTLDPSDANNYRPISNLTFISKLLERFVLNQLNAASSSSICCRVCSQPIDAVIPLRLLCLKCHAMLLLQLTLAKLHCLVSWILLLRLTLLTMPSSLRDYVLRLVWSTVHCTD